VNIKREQHEFPAMKPAPSGRSVRFLFSHWTLWKKEWTPTY